MHPFRRPSNRGPPPRRSTNPTGDRQTLANFELVQWDRASYQVPPIAPNHAPADTKQRCLDLTLSIVRDGSGNWNSKVNFLVNRFNLPITKTIAQASLAPLQLFHLNSYEYAGPEIYRTTANTLDIANPFTAAQRKNSYYIQFQLTVYPSRANPALSMQPRSTQTAVAIPRDPGTGTIQADIFHNHLTDITSFMALLHATNTPITIGTLRTDGGTRLDTEAYQEWYKRVYDEALFHSVTRALQDNYVGTAAVSDLPTRLAQIHQVTSSGTNPVTEHYKEFSSTVQQLDLTVPYPIDITRTFHDNLTEAIRTRLQATN